MSRGIRGGTPQTGLDLCAERKDYFYGTPALYRNIQPHTLLGQQIYMHFSAAYMSALEAGHLLMA